MKRKKLFEYRNIIKALTAALGIYISIRYAAECTEGIKKGIMFCLEVLIPSLFLFMVLSSYLVRSGLIQALSKPFGSLTRSLFRLPPPSLPVILLSMIGGYPIGARSAALLYEEGQLSASEAEKTACIAVCAGPGFLINYVGNALLHHTSAGTILLISEIAGVLITGLMVGRWMHSDPPIRRTFLHHHKQNSLLIRCVSDASYAAYRMCGMVILGAACIEVIGSLSPDAAVTDLLSAAIEITGGCQRLCGHYPLYGIAFFIGFGGLSVHGQIFAGMGEIPVNKALFFLFRIIQGIIAAVCTYILLMVFPIQQSVFNSTDVPMTFGTYATPVASAALVILSLCFTGSVHQKQLRR
ncbi:hypothetical protein [Ruminococcus sp.]|uniref:hypothetical protein n=1 Tax=Ruminococcus sp. TaxID=41978 RepID=UPI00388EBDE3